MTLATWASAPSGSPPGRPSLRCRPAFSWSDRTSKPTLTRVDAVDAAHGVGDGGLEVALDRAAGGRQRDGDVDDAAVLDVDRADHLELDDVAPQLGVDDDLQRLEDLVSRGHGLIVAGLLGRTRPRCVPARGRAVKDHQPARRARRRLREERVLHPPARYEAGEPYPARAALRPAGRGKTWWCYAMATRLGAGRDALAGGDADLDGVLDAVGDAGDAVGRGHGVRCAEPLGHGLRRSALRDAARLALEARARLADVALELVAGGVAAALEAV